VFCVVALYKSAFTYLYYLFAVLLYRVSTKSWKYWKSPNF